MRMRPESWDPSIPTNYIIALYVSLRVPVSPPKRLEGNF